LITGSRVLVVSLLSAGLTLSGAPGPLSQGPEPFSLASSNPFPGDQDEPLQAEGTETDAGGADVTHEDDLADEEYAEDPSEPRGPEESEEDFEFEQEED